MGVSETFSGGLEPQPVVVFPRGLPPSGRARGPEPDAAPEPQPVVVQEPIPTTGRSIIGSRTCNEGPGSRTKRTRTDDRQPGRPTCSTGRRADPRAPRDDLSGSRQPPDNLTPTTGGSSWPPGGRIPTTGRRGSRGAFPKLSASCQLSVSSETPDERSGGRHGSPRERTRAPSTTGSRSDDNDYDRW